MSENQTAGLFLVGNLVLGDKTFQQAYCRIIEATLCSAQSPQTARLLTYKVGVWDHEPAPSEKPLVYTCGASKQSTFSLRVALDLALDVESVQTQAIKHFLTLVVMGKPIRTTEDSMVQLYSANKAPWTHATEDMGMTFALSDVQNHVNFRAVDGEALGKLYSQTSYKAVVLNNRVIKDINWGRIDWNLIPRLEFPSEFADPTTMVSEAAANFQTPEAQATFLAAIRKQQAG